MLKRCLLILAIVLASLAILPIQSHRTDDYYPRWYGTRALIFQGLNPYGSQVSQAVQVAFYGHTLTPEEHMDEQRFAYPIYTVFLVLPSALLPYPAASIMMTWILLLSIAAATVFWIKSLNLQTDLQMRAILALLILSSPPALQAIRLVQLSALVGLFLAVVAFMVSKNRLIWAGVYLAFATIKPQMAFLPIAFTLLWTIVRWTERKKLFYGFVSTIALLLVGGEFLLQGWIADFLIGLAAYRHYASDSSIFTLLAGKPIGYATASVVIAALIGHRWTEITTPGNSDFAKSFSVILAASVFTMPLLALHNWILLIPEVLDSTGRMLRKIPA